MTTSQLDISLWLGLPAELKRQILCWALEDSGNMITFDEHKVELAANKYLAPMNEVDDVGSDADGLGLMFLPKALEVSNIARPIVYSQSQVLITSVDNAPLSPVRYPPRSFNHLITHLMVVIGAHDHHLRFLRRLASGILGFERLEGLFISVDTKTLWDTGNTASIHASIDEISKSEISFPVKNLEIESPLRESYCGSWKDAGDKEYDEAFQEICRLTQLVFSQISIAKPGRGGGPKVSWKVCSHKDRPCKQLYYD